MSGGLLDSYQTVEVLLRKMINSIKLCLNHSIRVRRFGVGRGCVRFQPGYNVLVGPNGSGKSTVLEALASCPLCRVERTDGNETKYITTETLNPLVGGTFSTREEMIQGVRALFHSHGQGVLDSLRSQRHGNETVVLIDSPETGQDMENCERIHDGLLRMAETFQVIVATNSLVFMRSGRLIDLGEDYVPRLVSRTREWASSVDALCKENKPSRSAR